jgi:YHS domain-containing protein
MKKAGILLLLAFYSTVSFAQTEANRKTTFNLKKGIAIDGYDPVSYFNGKPAEGRDQFKWNYKGITYLFMSQANLNNFKSSPEKYEPAYGGWCAYAMGDSGEKVKIDPETFKILDDRLYLFYNFWGSNTLKDWNKDEKKLKSSADSNWEKIIR